jgi:hypothetical protein
MMNTQDDLYCLPQRPENHRELESTIQSATKGLEYCAPVSGEHQQTVQMADLDGDGIDEYLVYAKGTDEDPLRILIFRRTADGFHHLQTIRLPGNAFDRVEYVPMDGNPGIEIVVGRQVSDLVTRSVSVYSLVENSMYEILSADYRQFLVTDLNVDKQSELLVLVAGQSDAQCGVAQLYQLENGKVVYSKTANMSQPVDHLKRIILGNLQGDVPAVYVASTVGNTAMITDVYTMHFGEFLNVSFSNESGTSVQTLRSYYVYANDIDSDGVIELPDLNPVRSSQGVQLRDHYLIHWYAMNISGKKVDKVHTYHNFSGGWYLQIPSTWTARISVRQVGTRLELSLAHEKTGAPEKVITVYTLRGDRREEEAKEDNRFILHRENDVIYAARLEVAAAKNGITSDMIRNDFHLIHHDWKTGET